jgi:hypothetical protein
LQAIKNNYEKIILGVLLAAFVGSGVYWLSYLRGVKEITEEEGGVIGVQNAPKRLDPLTSQDFTVMAKVREPDVEWGEIDGELTGDLLRGRSYMRCKSAECNHWIAYPIKVCPHCGTKQGETVVVAAEGDDEDEDGIPDTLEMALEFLNPTRRRDAYMDQDQDWFLNVEEYRYFAERHSGEAEYDGAELSNPALHPPLATRLRLVRLDRDVFGILLTSVMAVQDQPKEKWDIALKVREGNSMRSRFVKVGEEVQGYKVVDAEEKYEMRYNPRIRDEIRVDVSTVTIEKEGEEPMVLTKGERKYVGVVANLLLELTRSQAKRIVGVRAGDTLQLRDSLGQTETYSISVEDRLLRATLIVDGEPGETFVIDATSNLIKPVDLGMPGDAGTMMGRPYDEGLPPELRFAP